MLNSGGGGTPIKACQGGPVGLTFLPNGYQMARVKEGHLLSLACDLL